MLLRSLETADGGRCVAVQFQMLGGQVGKNAAECKCVNLGDTERSGNFHLKRRKIQDVKLVILSGERGLWDAWFRSYGENEFWSKMRIFILFFRKF